MSFAATIEYLPRRPIKSKEPWRHSQIGKAAVCKTVYSRFKSGCRLHFFVSPVSGASGGTGRHDGLKIRCPKGLEGSSPSSPTTSAHDAFFFEWTRVDRPSKRVDATSPPAHSERG